MEVHSGYLTIKTSGFWKKTSVLWCILYSGRSTWSSRLDLYEKPSDIAKCACKKSIFLDEAKWMVTESLEPAFAIDVKSKSYIFVTSQVRERDLWILHMCCVSGQLFDTRGCIGPLNPLMSSLLRPGTDDFIVQENVLYSTSSTEGTCFLVIAEEEDGCQRLGLNGVYRLCVGTSIYLLQIENDKEVAEWPYQGLRNYGRSNHSFFLHAGSRCKTGEGYFSFFTTEGEKLVQTVALETQKLQLQEGNIETSTLPAAGHEKSENIKNTSYSPGLSGGATEHQGALKMPVLVPRKSSDNSEQIPQRAFKDSNHQIVGKNNSVPLNDQFKKQLNEVITHPSLEVGKTSVDHSLSSGSDKKDNKKQLKKLEEERKKKKKEDKKREKELQKPKRRENGVQDPPKHTFTKELSLEDDINPYDEAEPTTAEPTEDGPSNKIYSEPWGSIPALNFPSLKEENANFSGAIYSTPEKVNVELKRNDMRQRADAFDVMYEYEAIENDPPIIPTRHFDSEDAEDNVYEHLHQSSSLPTSDVNVYGLASASSLPPGKPRVRPKPDKSKTESTLYETVE